MIESVPVDDLDNRIEFRIPPDTRFIRVARLAASGVGAGAGLSINRIDDLKIAVGEVCATLIEIGGGAPITLGLAYTPAGDVRVDARVPVDDAMHPDGARFALTGQILGVIAGDAGFRRGPGSASFAFDVSPTPRAPNPTNN